MFTHTGNIGIDLHCATSSEAPELQIRHYFSFFQYKGNFSVLNEIFIILATDAVMMCVPSFGYLEFNTVVYMLKFCFLT